MFTPCLKKAYFFTYKCQPISIIFDYEKFAIRGFNNNQPYMVCVTAVQYNKWPSYLLGMADRIAHSRRSVQKLLHIHLAMLIYRDRGVKVKIRINVPVS